MNIRCILATLAMTGALLAAGAVPAFAGGPPVPPGCSFDQATGVLTCVTATTTASTIGPITTNGMVPADSTFDGFTGVQICIDGLGVPAGPSFVQFSDLVLGVTIATTTTTEQHGLHGKVFDTSTSTAPPSLNGSHSGSATCFIG